MTRQSAEVRRYILGTVEIAVCLLILSGTVASQELPLQQVPAPPPPTVISRDDQTQIDAAKDAKARVKLTLDLAEQYLTTAEQSTTHTDFETASKEVGKYYALIDDALKFVRTQAHDSNKTRDLYKRIELTLRAHGPRLTSMRRTTPLEFAIWIKEVEDFARKGRTEALDSFYGHTVIREQKGSSSDKAIEQTRKDNSLAPEKKQP